MTRNPAAKTLLKRVLPVATAIIGMAWIGTAYAEDSLQSELPGQTASVEKIAAAPDERMLDLRSHGDRFDLARQATEKSARKPEWTWDDIDEDGLGARRE